MRPEFNDLYKETKIRYDTAIKLAKQAHFGNLICKAKNKSKMVCRAINDIRGDSKSVVKKPKFEGDLSKVANDFNEYFVNVASGRRDGFSGQKCSDNFKKLKQSFYKFE
ncbi:hypothetical protein WA026_020483, partial [Henosepilachna vigintioctopunctata]